MHIFEMKYRTMMFDCASADDCFGYIFCDKAGRIASVGTLCKIVERELLEDGRQAIKIKGIGRFTARKILKTLPYVVAEVEPDLHDEPLTASAVAAAVQLEKETWGNLKYYIRLVWNMCA